MIAGEVRRYLRDNSAIRVSRSIRDVAYRVLQCKEAMTARLGRDPSLEEIAKELSRVSGYSPELTPYASSYAGYKDWFISFYNLPGYTVELGRGVNPIPISEFQSIYPPNKRLLAEALFLA